MTRRRILAIRCRDKHHLLGSIEVGAGGNLWFIVPRPRVATARNGVMRHERYTEPNETDLTARLAEFTGYTEAVRCACGVDYAIMFPHALEHAQTERELVLEPIVWTPPRD